MCSTFSLQRALNLLWSSAGITSFKELRLVQFCTKWSSLLAKASRICRDTHAKSRTEQENKTFKISQVKCSHFHNPGDFPTLLCGCLGFPCLPSPGGGVMGLCVWYLLLCLLLTIKDSPEGAEWASKTSRSINQHTDMGTQCLCYSEDFFPPIL